MTDLPPPLPSFPDAAIPQHRNRRLSTPMLLLGLVLGAAVSAFFWLRGFRFDADHINQLVTLVVVIVAVKAIVGIAMLFFNARSRGFGTGVLLSILPGFLVFVVGFLISAVFGIATFFGNCATSMQNSNGTPGVSSDATTFPVTQSDQPPAATMPSQDRGDGH